MSKIMNMINKLFEKGDITMKYDDSLIIPTGGIVENNSKVKDIIDKLFNTKPNEQVVKLLNNNELIISADAMKKFIPNLQNLIKSINN